MNLRKNMPYFIITIICVVLFGIWYMDRFQAKKEMVFVASVNPQTDSTIQKPKPLIETYITGQVKEPGLYKIEEGTRVHEALDLAGGYTDIADLSRVNLAAFVLDGQHLHIPIEGEAVDKTQSLYQNNVEMGRVNINIASIDDLKQLPGVGNAIASDIIQYRNQYGPFETIEDIMKVDRIGDKAFERMKDLIRID